MSFSVQQIRDWAKAELINQSSLEEAIENISVNRVSPLERASQSDLGFFFSRAFEGGLAQASPGILVMGASFLERAKQLNPLLWKSTAIMVCKDPYFAMAVLSEKFAALSSSVAHLSRCEKEWQALKNQPPQIHPSAVIASSAKIGAAASVGAHCVVEEAAELGMGCVLYPGCYVGPRCLVGKASVLFPNVTLYEWTEIGSGVRIHSGAVIGADGFGYAPRFSSNGVESHQKIYHLGKVVIEDDVEIGANTTIDRATWGETRVGRGAKVDNLVQLGHNVRLGEGAIICGSTGLAGNASVGRFAYIGGVCGISNHTHVGDGAKVGAMTLVTKDVPPGKTVVGSPQREHREHFKAHALLTQLLNERRQND